MIQETQLKLNRLVGGGLIPHQASSITPNRSRPTPTSVTRGCRCFSSPTNDDHNQHSPSYCIRWWPAAQSSPLRQYHSKMPPVKHLLREDFHCPPTRERSSVKYQSAHPWGLCQHSATMDPYHSLSHGSVFNNEVWVSALGVASFFCCAVAQSYQTLCDAVDLVCQVSLSFTISGVPYLSPRFGDCSLCLLCLYFL